ncbi:SpaH/EbpB family LPXTG-anchored major pilin [Gardnerella vaginalis]|uniref:SpaH/EbpB family LPXTG-anchored major pilin n=1 Tax=Gardnerella vaginalis TaxID=2702 RepID=UPI00200C433C|nr:SpaH/EbpB family LPXTG-anchored major pilin [Gardnerella vaginalis]
MNKITKQCVAAIASLAMAGTLCVAGAVVAGNSAWAVDSATAAKAPWEDTAKTGSITIHKKDDTSGTAVGLNGATFTVQKVSKIGTAAVPNLAKQEDWITLASKVKELNDAAKAGNPTSKVTFDTNFGKQGKMSQETKTVDGEAGIAKFDNLAIGLYYVEETKVPTGYSPEFTPFFITVPQITREDGKTTNTYTYAVSVSPKNWNANGGITKDAQTSKMVGAGDTLPYVITAKVKLPLQPAMNGKSLSSSNFTGFKVWDDALISAYSNLTDFGNTATNYKVQVGEYDSSKKALKKGAVDLTKTGNDFSVNDSATVTPADNTRKRILFTFEDAGLTKIASAFGTDSKAYASKDIRVQVTLNLKIKSDFGSTGVKTTLTNKYGFNPGGDSGKDTPGTDTKTVFHKFHVFKYDGTTSKGSDAGKDGRKALPGAEFKAFADKNEAVKCAKDPSGNDNCKNAMPGFTANAANAGTSTITTTGSNGKTSDYVAKTTDAQSSKIYLVEVKAPNGYVRSEDVHEVDTAKAKDNESLEVPIADVPTSNNIEHWFKLPNTGAYGVIIFAIIGLGLVGAGTFMYMRNNRKKEEEQAA